MKPIASLMLAAAVMAGPAGGLIEASALITEKETAMKVQSTNLFLLDDLNDINRTSKLDGRDLHALQAVTEWINSFIVGPHKDLGRAGPVCPFVPGALKNNTLWLAPERIAGKSVAEVTQLVEGYKNLLLDVPPIDGDAAAYKSFVVVFTDMSTDRAKEVFDEVLKNLAVPSYAEDGVVMGPFYESNEATAIYNASFRPFRPPVPFLLVRRAVISDWKFFLNNKDLFGLWAHRYGESGTEVLAEELRNLPWNARRN
jgi:hypothetical protein